MKTDIDLKPVIELAINLNGNVKPKGLKPLSVRFYKRTPDFRIVAYVFETPYSDKEKAIEFARGRFKKDWKLDKGFLKRQINNLK